MTVPDILTLVANPEALETLDAESLKHHFVVLNGHYAGSQDPALVPILLELYGRWAEQSEPSQRLPVLADTIGLAEEEWGAPFLALMPFIAAETDHQVISSAALGLASVAPGECDSDKGTYAGASWVADLLMANEERSSAWMKQASRSVTLAESILVTSLLDADAAETTGQLMIPSLLKLCLRRYDEGTAEAEAIGSYFEQTLAEGGLDQDEPPERWFADAFAFARALVKEHPETGRAILVSVGPEAVAESREVYGEARGAPGTQVTEAVALQAAQNYVETELGYHGVPSIRLWNLDRILNGVDLVIWAVLLEAFPDL
jgi:hypothetical protein